MEPRERFSEASGLLGLQSDISGVGKRRVADVPVSSVGNVSGISTVVTGADDDSMVEDGDMSIGIVNVSVSSAVRWVPPLVASVTSAGAFVAPSRRRLHRQGRRSLG